MPVTAPSRGEERGVRYAVLALLGWTALTAGAFVAERERGRAVVRDAAELEAQNSVQHLVITRRWISGHGGVYVPITGLLQPSPYLAFVPDRAARTAEGRELTLMNPAWMTRQLLELTNQEHGVSGHITSLRPLRPENAPDPWERDALQRLAAGASDHGELVTADGEERFRYMAPLRMEHPCVGCHGAQGYREGDLRGGIAVSVPLAPLMAIGANDFGRQMLVHGIIYALGVLGILVVLADQRRRSAADAEADRRKADAEAQLAAGRRLEAVGRLSAGLAHDFNNLLAPILTVAGIVKDELPPESPLREDLEEIRDAARKARDLVRGLQTLSRKNGATVERLDVATLVTENEELLRSFAGTRLGFVLDVAADVPAVVADRPLLELALANLVINAREGRRDGRPIKMSVGAAELAEADAERLLLRPGRHAAVTLAEAGVDVSLLSGAAGFSVVQGGGCGDAGGAGFGLQTINGIVAQYGGAVVVRQAAAGWVFLLLLPEARPGSDQES
ncbi:MAG: DUF3365 domain-containing protein [Anaeromyxobacteraceae bacterium]